MFVLLGVARQSLFQLSCIKAFALTLYPLLCETGSHFVALAGLELPEIYQLFASQVPGLKAGTTTSGNR